MENKTDCPMCRAHRHWGLALLVLLGIVKLISLCVGFFLGMKYAQQRAAKQLTGQNAADCCCDSGCCDDACCCGQEDEGPGEGESVADWEKDAGAV